MSIAKGAALVKPRRLDFVGKNAKIILNKRKGVKKILFSGEKEERETQEGGREAFRAFAKAHPFPSRRRGRGARFREAKADARRFSIQG